MTDDLYRGRYRIPSARAAWWDYASNAAYFVTVCVADRSHAFGEIDGDAMVLSPLGQAAWDCWEAIPGHFPFAAVDAFVVMPNHVHGIIVIEKTDVETQDLASLQTGYRFGPQSRDLASIVRGYKIGVTLAARRQGIAFGWQGRYHDHIIRDAADFERIRGYIARNPQQWAGDVFHHPPRAEEGGRR